MRLKRFTPAFFTVVGYALLVVSLTVGCGWRVEGEGFRIESGADNSPDETSHP